MSKEEKSSAKISEILSLTFPILQEKNVDILLKSKKLKLRGLLCQNFEDFFLQISDLSENIPASTIKL